MIEIVRQWLTGVTCAALMAAIADGLMPKGAVKQVGKLVCSLVLLCAVLRPILKIQIPDTAGALNDLTGQMEQQRTQLENDGAAMLKTLIERESAAYIVDKAAQLGIDCQALVTCSPGEAGTWFPRWVHITGQLDEHQRKALSDVIRDELGVVPECQVYAGGE